MSMAQGAQLPSPAMGWTGWTLTVLGSLFMAMDGVMKLAKPSIVVKTTVELGYPESAITGMGIALLVCTALYVVPRTSVLGAILLTGYLGGAVASHVRIGGPVFSILFPAIMGAILWLGIYCRYSALRSLVPLVTQTVPSNTHNGA